MFNGLVYEKMFRQYVYTKAVFVIHSGAHLFFLPLEQLDSYLKKKKNKCFLLRRISFFRQFSTISRCNKMQIGLVNIAPARMYHEIYESCSYLLRPIKMVASSENHSANRSNFHIQLEKQAIFFGFWQDTTFFNLNTGLLLATLISVTDSSANPKRFEKRIF